MVPGEGESLKRADASSAHRRGISLATSASRSSSTGPMRSLDDDRQLICPCDPVELMMADIDICCAAMVVIVDYCCYRCPLLQIGSYDKQIWETSVEQRILQVSFLVAAD